jgi:hypothetical protein
MRWAGRVARVWDRRVPCRVLLGRPDRERPLGRPGHRWESNIKINPWEVGWGGTYSFDLAQDENEWRAFVYAALNPRVLYNAGNFLTSWGPLASQEGLCFMDLTCINAANTNLLALFCTLYLGTTCICKVHSFTFPTLFHSFLSFREVSSSNLYNIFLSTHDNQSFV